MKDKMEAVRGAGNDGSSRALEKRLNGKTESVFVRKIHRRDHEGLGLGKLPSLSQHQNKSTHSNNTLILF